MAGFFSKRRDMNWKHGVWQASSSLVLVLFIWYGCVPNELVNGYYIKNCTTHLSGNVPGHPKVMCWKQGFYTVPSDIPSNVTELDLSVNFISQIQVGNFKDFAVLQNLKVSSNQIWNVEKGAFKDLFNLRELNIAENHLTIISNVFYGLVNLETLRLDGNRISRIASSAFSQLTNIKRLNMSNNRLNHIEQIQPIIKLPALQNLHIGMNNFTTFQSKDISNISLGIKLLDLSWNPLKLFQLTADILPHLEVLDVSYIRASGDLKWDVRNQSFLRSVNRANLSGIQISREEINKLFYSLNASMDHLDMNEMNLNITDLLNITCQMPTLRVIRSLSNGITSIDDQLFMACTRLSHLDVSSNMIHHLSEHAFKPLKQLINLRITRNELTAVPSAIQYLPVLDIVDLTFNKMTKIGSSDFSHLGKLRKLYLFHNQISVLSPCVFKYLPSLQTLKLGDNKIVDITGVFCTLQKLKHLELGGNKLSTIRKADFEGLCALTYLDLFDNQITVIDNEAFAKLTNLQQLYLQKNKITADIIGSKIIFAGTQNLKKLHLSYNYISYYNIKELEHPPFSLLKSLTHLEISNLGRGKGQLYLPRNLLKGLTSLRELHAEHSRIETLHSDTFRYTPQLAHLDISGNFFTALSPQVFQNIPKLTELMMNSAGLQSLDFLILANLSRLRVLHVNQNKLDVINDKLIHSLPALTYLSLESNTFICDCDNAFFINWTNNSMQTQVIGASSLICSYPADYSGKRLLDLDTSSCNVDIGFKCFISTTVAVLSIMLGSSFYHFLRWKVIYAYYLFLAYIYDYRQKKKQKGLRDFEFDAFISYNSRDEPRVLEELVLELEDNQGWKLCLHHRDFEPGKPILDNIVEGIYSSRKTICLISRCYLESEWCSREIQVASFRLFDEKKDVLILVFLEDIPSSQLSPYHRMRKLVKRRTYLSWPKPGEDTRVFWQKLGVALETKDGPEHENQILSGLEN